MESQEGEFQPWTARRKAAVILGVLKGQTDRRNANLIKLGGISRGHSTNTRLLLALKG